MAIELAAAYISLLPETSKIAPGVRQALGDVEGKVAQDSGKRTGSNLAASLGKAFGGGVKAVATGAIATLGTALVKGFSRLNALDQANGKLLGLGHSAATVDAIMKNALASVKGTAFGMDEAATTAASAVAAGIKPGRDLEKTLKLVADAATIGGASMAEMGLIFNSVAARGKLQGDDIMQLQSRGIPILAEVAKITGKTRAEVSQMAEKGQIDFDLFQKAMDSALGGAALKSGDRFAGSLKNVGAALGRVGANLESGFFPKLAPLLQAITKALGPLEDQAKSFGAAIGDKVAPLIERATQALEKGLPPIKLAPEILGPATAAFAALGASGLAPVLSMVPGLGGLASKIGLLGGPLGLVAAAIVGLIAVSPELRTAMGDAFTEIATSAAPLLPVMADLARELLPELANWVKAATVALAQAMPYITSVTGAFLSNETAVKVLGIAILGTVAAVKAYNTWIAVSELVTAKYEIVTGMAAAAQQGFAEASYGTSRALAVKETKYKAATTAGWVYAKSLDFVRAAQQKMAVATSLLASKLTLATAAQVAKTVAEKAAAIGSALVTAAQWALNVAMDANPIGIIVLAIAALVAGLIWAYNNVEPFRNAVNGAFEGIKYVAGVVIDWFTGTLVPGIQWVWGQIAGFFEGAANTVRPYIDAFLKANGILFDGVKDVFGKIGEFLGAAFNFLFGPILNFPANMEKLWTGPLDNVRKVVEVFAAVTWLGLRALGDWLVGTFQGLWGAVADYITGTWNNLSGAAKLVWGAISGFIQGALDLVTGGIKAFVDANVLLFSILWDWISSVFVAVQTGWGLVTGAFQAAITWVKGVFAGAWSAIYPMIKGPLDMARTAIEIVWRNVTGAFQAAVTWVKTGFKAAWDGLVGIMKGPIDLAKQGIDTALRFVQTAFDNTVKGVAKAWEAIKSAMGAPVKWVADNVVNPLIRAFNKVADAVGMPNNKLDEWHFKGFATGGYTGNLRPDEVAGLVHGDEHVIRSASRRRLEKALPGGLDILNRTGMWPVGPLGNDASINQQASRGSGVPANLAGVPGDLRQIAARGPRSGDKGLGGPVDWGLAMNGAMGWYRRCLAFVNAAWQYSVGRFGLATARQSMNAGPRSMDGVPPAGAGVYWDTGPAGHIALAVGDGTVLSNDIRVPGRIDRVPQREVDRWGPYRGWWSPNGLGAVPGRSLGSVIGGVLFGGFPGPVEWLTSLITGPLGKIGGAPGGAWGDLIGGLPKMIGSGMTAKLKEVFHFDTGGWLQPGMLATSNLSAPEPVFTGSQWDVLRGNLASGSGDTEVRVFIGERELTDIVSTEVVRSFKPARRTALQTAGSGRVGA